MAPTAPAPYLAINQYAHDVITQAAREIANHRVIRHINKCEAVVGDPVVFVDAVFGFVLNNGYEYLTELGRDHTLSDQECAGKLLEHMNTLRQTTPLGLSKRYLDSDKPLPEPGWVNKPLPEKPLPDESLTDGQDESPDASSKSIQSSIPTGKARKLGQLIRKMRVPFPRSAIDQIRKGVSSLRSSSAPPAKSALELATIVKTGIPSDATSQRDTSVSEAVKAYLGAEKLPDWLTDELNHNPSGKQWYDNIQDALSAMCQGYKSAGMLDAARLCDTDIYYHSNNEPLLKALQTCEADRLILRARPTDGGEAKYLTLARGTAQEGAERSWYAGLYPDTAGPSTTLQDLLQWLNPGDTQIDLIEPNV
jgi:hypothetical protein